MVLDFQNMIHFNEGCTCNKQDEAPIPLYRVGWETSRCTAPQKTHTGYKEHFPIEEDQASVIRCEGKGEWKATVKHSRVAGPATNSCCDAGEKGCCTRDTKGHQDTILGWG